MSGQTANGGESAVATMVAKRRRLVAGMRVRGVTLREIVDALGKSGEHNPETGRPWGLSTIAGDCRAITAEWRQACSADTATHQARVWAELQEVKRSAWQAHRIDLVLKALQQEAALLGLDAPSKVDLTVWVEQLAEEYGMDKRTAVAEAQRILAQIPARV